MRVAVRRMMYAVSLLGAVACGSHQVTPMSVPLGSETRLEHRLCQAVLVCAPSSPLGLLAAANMITADTTLDGCLEIGEQMRDAISPELAAQWAAELSTNPCMY